MAGEGNGVPKQDVSQIRTPIHISGKPVEQVLNSIHYGSPELRCLLMDECNLIFECKVCRALFRDLPNFISHKRLYCTKSSLEDRHVTLASLPEEKVVVIQPQAPEETDRSSPVIHASKSVRPTLEETIQRIQSGDLGKSHAYKVYTEAAEKLQKQKEGMKVATIRTSTIPTNKNAVFIDVNMTSVNIHERQQQISGGSTSSGDSIRPHAPVIMITRKTGERLGSLTSRSSRHTRKPIKLERHSSEPQKLLMDQLKEIQHKVRQKAAAQEKVQKSAQEKISQHKSLQDKSSPQKIANAKGTAQRGALQKVKISPLNDSCSKVTVSPVKKESPRKSGTSPSAAQQSRMRTSDPEIDLKDLARQNLQSLLTKEETKVRVKNEIMVKEGEPAATKRNGNNKLRELKDSKSSAAKAVIIAKQSKRIPKSLICSKCNSIFASRKSLSFHLKIHHSASRTFYPCPYCTSTFYYFFGITRHLLNNHGKTLGEIDDMRKQLRDISYIKPLSPVLTRADLRFVIGTRRSARSAFQITRSNSTTSDVVDMCPVTEKQLPRKKDKANSDHISKSSVKSVNIKREITQTPKSARLDPATTQAERDEKNVECIGKENTTESRTSRLKNRQQQRSPGDSNRGHSPLGLTETSLDTLRPSSPASSTAVSEESHENSPYVCSKCHRQFGRKKSFENHIQVCQAEEGSMLNPSKLDRSQISGRLITLGSSQLDPKEMNSAVKGQNSNNLAVNETVPKTLVRVGKPTSNDPEKGPEIIRVSTRSRRREGSNDSQRSVSSKSSSMASSVERTHNQTQRAASVDRGFKLGASDNRSVERRSATDMRRDSSAESTQSNVECKSSRSERSVFSRYAVQSPASPKKSQILRRPGIKSISDKMERNNQTKLQIVRRGNKTYIYERAIPKGKRQSRVGGVRRNSKLNCDSSMSNMEGGPNLLVSHLKTRASTDNSPVIKNSGKGRYPVVLPGTKARLISRGEIKQGAGLSPKMFFAPRNPHKSLPIKNTVMQQNHLAQEKMLGSSSQSNILVQHAEPSKCVPDQRFASTVKSSTGQSKLHPMSLNVQEDIKCRLDEEKSQVHILAESMKPSVNEVKLAGAAREVKIKETESVQTEPKEIKEIVAGQVTVLKSECSEVQPSTTQLNVVTALSDRPRRKRRVPSRNIDAEEMLSKIHNHSRDKEPAAKRLKLTPETILSVVPKTKSRKGSAYGDNETDVARSSIGIAKCEGKQSDSFKGLSSLEDRREQEQDQDDEVEEDDELKEGWSRGKGRMTTNRLYVLGKSGLKKNKLTCYDLSQVHRYLDEDKLECLVCGESCSQIFNLRRHIIRQHLKWSRFQCKLCSYQSYDRSECNTHILRSHKNVYVRSMSSLIIDLVKQGSKARSLKKTRTIRVKQQSESESGNIYARPMVKKRPRLAQRVTDGITKIQDHQSSRKRDSFSETNSQSGGLSQEFTHTKSKESKVGTPVVVQALSTSGCSKAISSKTDSNPTYSRTARNKSRPFNISTRNSPRVFDTRPYRAESLDDDSQDSESETASKNESHSQTEKGAVTKVVRNDSGSNNLPECTVKSECGSSRGKGSYLKATKTAVSTGHQMGKFDISLELRENSEADRIVPLSIAVASDSLGREGPERSRNIFDNLRGRSITTKASSQVSECSEAIARANGASATNSEADQSNNKGVKETKLQKIGNDATDVLDKLPEDLDKLETSLVPSLTNKSLVETMLRTPSHVSSTSVTSQSQKSLTSPNEYVQYNQLAKSLMKLKKLGDQLSSATSTLSSTPATHVIKTSTPALLSSADAATQQPKLDTSLTVSSASSVTAAGVRKIVPLHKTIATSLETSPLTSSFPTRVTAAGISSAVKNSTTSALAPSSFILSHASSGRVIVYSRPAEDKEFPSTLSSSMSSSSSSTLSSSSVSTIIVRAKEPGTSSGLATIEATGEEEELPSGTFVIKQQFL